MTDSFRPDFSYDTMDEKTSTQLLRRVMPSARRPSTLLVYNTVERLVSGDLLHTVTIDDVWADVFTFPSDFVVVGIGTTTWLKRNGEMMPDGTARKIHFWWADPKTAPQPHLIDLQATEPEQDLDEGTIVKQYARFPFLALAMCDPNKEIVFAVEDIDDLHPVIIERLQREGIKMAGVRVHGDCRYVKATDAHYLPDTGIDLSGGYSGDDYFITTEYKSGTWTMNGVYMADTSLQPFVTVPGLPLHLHGYEPQKTVGGHIVQASVTGANVSLFPLTDVVVKIQNV